MVIALHMSSDINLCVFLLDISLVVAGDDDSRLLFQVIPHGLVYNLVLNLLIRYRVLFHASFIFLSSSNILKIFYILKFFLSSDLY